MKDKFIAQRNILCTWIALSCILINLKAQNLDNTSTKNTVQIKEDDTPEKIILKATKVIPTENQLQALQDGFIGFIHFGPNTYTKKEWGTGREHPSIFNPDSLDTDQWCKSLKEAGMKKVIFTAKHHDGFVLWQSRYTNHGIMSSPYNNGKGDILKELSKSCQKYGLKLGVYLSPADLFQMESTDGLYGNSSSYTERIIPRKVKGRPFKNKTTFKFMVDDYNEYFLNQLFELLTEYGPISEVWFDGAHPKKKGNQKYAYQSWKTLIHKLAPNAVIFGKEDLRWVGNEAGKTRPIEWNVIPFEKDPSQINMFEDMTDSVLGSRDQLYKAKYLHYYPAEVDVSIRDGWFFRDEESQEVKSPETIFDIYESAVGGNAIFLLNIPPNRHGRLSEKDVAVLKKVGTFIKNTYHDNLLRRVQAHKNLLDDNLNTFEILSPGENIIEFHLKQPILMNRLLLQEAIHTYGERVEEYALQARIHGEWHDLAQGTNIGFKDILRFPDITSDTFRIKFIKARNIPVLATVAAYYFKEQLPSYSVQRDIDGMVYLSVGSQSKESSKVSFSDRTQIRYGINGDYPNTVYQGPFFLSNGLVKTRIQGENQKSSISEKTFGLYKKHWKIIASSSSKKWHSADQAIDANLESYWVSSGANKDHFIAIDLGKKYTVNGFIYSPKKVGGEGLIQKAAIKISEDGHKWKTTEIVDFGNVMNDPSTRIFSFKEPVISRYFKIQVMEIAGDANTVTASEIGFSVLND